MRTHPCWTSYPFQLALSWIAAFLVAAGVVLLAECSPAPAYAEAYMDLAGGYTRFLLTASDGDYVQKDLPHSLDLSSVAYKVGIGWRFNERWSIQGAYINLGTIKQDARFVDDRDYSAKQSKCLANCAQAGFYKMTDAYHGGELTVTRMFHLSPDWSLDLKGGGAMLFHRFTIRREGTTDEDHEHYGRFPATVAGLGLSYKWVYAEMDYYHGLGGSNCYSPCGWPLSKEMIVTWAGVKIPFPQ